MLLMQTMMEDSLWLDQYQAKQLRKSKRPAASVEMLEDDGFPSRISSCESVDSCVGDVKLTTETNQRVGENLERLGSSQSLDLSFARVESMPKRPRSMFESTASLFVRTCRSSCKHAPVCIEG